MSHQSYSTIQEKLEPILGRRKTGYGRIRRAFGRLRLVGRDDFHRVAGELLLARFS